ncbi:MAG: acyltransferase [Clostridia bacterium]|nr:acyltransferase [Clostridia bacterium]
MNTLQNKAKKRNSAIELLRIIAMIMILFSHFSVYSGFDFNSSAITFPRLWYNLISMCGKTGAAIYVLISGYFLITDTRSDFNIKKVLTLWGQIEFFSVSVYLISVITGNADFSLTKLIAAFLPISFGIWWFASSYFVLFLIHPFINKALLSMDKKSYKHLLILLLTIWCIIPTILNKTFEGNNLLWMIMLYCIAGYIRLYGSDYKVKKKTCAIVFILAFVLTYLSTFLFTVLGVKYVSFAQHIQFFSRQVSICTIIMSVSLFTVVVKSTEFNSKVINILSSATFGVYLIHESPYLRNLIWKKLLHGTAYSDSLNLILYSIFAVLAVYICCSAIDIIRAYTVAKPYNKLVNKYSSKLTAPLKKIINKI